MLRLGQFVEIFKMLFRKGKKIIKLYNDVIEMQKWKKKLFLNIVELNERFKCHFSKDVLAYFQNSFSVIFRKLSISSIFEHMLDRSRNCDSLIGY